MNRKRGEELKSMEREGGWEVGEGRKLKILSLFFFKNFIERIQLIKKILKGKKLIKLNYY